MMRRAKVLTVAGLLLLGVTCFLIFFFSSEAVSTARFDQVTVGMTEAQVQQIMGAPRRIWCDTPSAGTTEYFYGGLPRWCIMEVFFRSDGRVTGKNHDHY